MKWCCLPFQSNAEKSADARGVTVFFGSEEGCELKFLLRFRAVDNGKEKSIATSTPLSLMEEIRIHYCPWCGKDLKKIYKDGFGIVPD